MKCRKNKLFELGCFVSRVSNITDAVFSLLFWPSIKVAVVDFQTIAVDVCQFVISETKTFDGNLLLQFSKKRVIIIKFCPLLFFLRELNIVRKFRLCAKCICCSTNYSNNCSKRSTSLTPSVLRGLFITSDRDGCKNRRNCELDFEVEKFKSSSHNILK